ncbi:MAG: hypothetical protein AMXMBFR34_12810 [Myxococcaceae bacterium]
MIAISTDDRETSARFRESLKAPYHFIADEDGKLVRQFDVKTPIVNYAKRTTFVVGPGRKILAIQEGGDAIDPSGAVAACSLKPPEAMKYVTGGDGGAPKK